MSKPLDLSGRRFGRLAAVDRADRHPGAWWTCRCDCGCVSVVIASALTSGNTASCGCGQRDAAGALHRTHGRSKTPEHRAWKNMLDRCRNRRRPEFKHYGGRGISVCERWLRFDAFFDDMGTRPSPLHTLDRVDVNGNYEPSNCRWATRQEQADNTRVTHILTVTGESAPLGVWARRTGLTKEAIRDRLRRGWSSDRAVLTPKLRTHTPSPTQIAQEA